MSRLLPLFACAALAGCGPGVDVRLADLGAIDDAIEAHRGHALLINHWATWCLPCVGELPDLVAVAAQHRDAGGRLLTISHDLALDEKSLDDVRAFAEKNGYTFPILVFPGDALDAVLDRFDVPGPIPYTIAVDRDGNVVDTHEGVADPERLDAMMRRALE